MAHEYLTTQETAEYLRCSPQYLNIARCRHKGPPYCRLGRAVRYRKAALDAWMLRSEARTNAAKGAANV